MFGIIPHDTWFLVFVIMEMTEIRVHMPQHVLLGCTHVEAILASLSTAATSSTAVAEALPTTVVDVLLFVGRTAPDLRHSACTWYNNACHRPYRHDPISTLRYEECAYRYEATRHSVS